MRFLICQEGTGPPVYTQGSDAAVVAHPPRSGAVCSAHDHRGTGVRPSQAKAGIQPIPAQGLAQVDRQWLLICAGHNSSSSSSLGSHCPALTPCRGCRAQPAPSPPGCKRVTGPRPLSAPHNGCRSLWSRISAAATSNSHLLNSTLRQHHLANARTHSYLRQCQKRDMREMKPATSGGNRGS